MFWSTVEPTPPRAYVFSTEHMHVHNARQFMEAVSRIMPTPAFKISLLCVDSEDASGALVSVGAVVHLAKIMTRVSAHQTLLVARDTLPFVVAFEVGKVEAKLQHNDRIVVLSEDPRLLATFAGHPTIACLDISACPTPRYVGLPRGIRIRPPPRRRRVRSVRPARAAHARGAAFSAQTLHFIHSGADSLRRLQAVPLRRSRINCYPRPVLHRCRA